MPEPTQRPASARTVRLLAVMLVISIGLHAATFVTLLQAREATRDQALLLANEIGAIGEESLKLDVPLNQPIPVRASVPIRTTIEVPIDTSIDLDTEFTVPLKTPFGTYDIPVPFRGEVPVKLTAPVSIDETVQVSTTIQLDTRLAVDLPVRDTPLASYLDRLREGLLDLAGRL